MSHREEFSTGEFQRPSATEERFQLLVQSVVDYAIYMLDPDGYITSWNSGAQQIKGYSAAEALGKNFSMFYTPEDRANGMPGKALAIAREKGRFNGEAWRVRRDGSRFRALVAIDAIRDSDGELIGFAKVTRDITEHWEAVARLEESERRFRLFVQGVPDYAICMLDERGSVRHWNAGARSISGYDSVDMLGMPIATLFSEEDRLSGVMGRLLKEALERDSCEAEYWNFRKDGTRFLAHISLRALKDEDHILRGYAHIIRDMSEQRAAEQELEATRELLVQSQKLDALGQLTGGVAHDFNNILQAITGGLEVASLRLAKGDNAQAQHYLDGATRSVERAMHLTRRLLAFARRQPLMPTCLNLNQLVSSMTEMLERTVGARVTVDIELNPSVLYVFCDANQLETALLNLAINGRDAMPNGGYLRITTQPGPPGPNGQQFASVSVADNGVGIPNEMIARVFDPFFTTKPLGQGTGLGLSMIHGFVQQSQGMVHLDSKLGVGTRVDMHLPLCEPPPPRD
ncbi:MAG TPA: PAS domain S-box protein [Dyella sp.]